MQVRGYQQKAVSRERATPLMLIGYPLLRPCPYISHYIQHQNTISLRDIRFGANTERFQGLVPLSPHLCPLSVPKEGVCGVYSESP